MSERSPLSRWAPACAALLFAIAGPCMADGRPQDDPDEPLLRYRTTAQLHGLYEIREEARRFLRTQPRKKSGDWVAVGPDIRMQAPLCAVPLRSRWARESDNTENLPGVLVVCKKSIDKKKPNWSIFVDAYIPAERKLEMQRRFPKLSSQGAPEPK
jgi:hypothetical protein